MLLYVDNCYNYEYSRCSEVCIKTCFACCFTGIESLLVSLRSLNEKVGTYEEEEEFRQLEDMLQSSTFKKAKEVRD